MNHARPVVADEADVIAVDAMNAGDLAEAALAGAIAFRDLLVDAGQAGAIGEYAAGVVAGDARAGAGEFGAERHGLGDDAVLAAAANSTATPNAIKSFRTIGKPPAQATPASLESPCGGMKAASGGSAPAGNEIHIIE